MPRRAVAALVFAALLAAMAAPRDAAAHAALRSSNPVAGVRLGAAPATITLTFTERPAPSLSQLVVLDSRGVARQRGAPTAVAGDARSLVVGVARLPRGVYTVRYRAVSAVDGHPTAGQFAFGVRATPAAGAATARSTTPDGSAGEMLARGLLIAGLVALLGGATAGAAGFGGTSGSDLRLAAAGWLVGAVGLVALLEAQRRSSDATASELLDSAVGRALIWRALALAVAGLALLSSWRAADQERRYLLAAAAAAAGAVVAVHVSAGHAGAGSWPVLLSAGAQSAHFAAAGVWIGGLAALLLGTRGAASPDRARSVRRFSIVAAGGLAVVAIAGTVRAVDELGSVGELLSSAYGRAVLAKIALLALIAALALRNRRRSVPAAAGGDLGPLRRTSRGELALAAAALAVAAVLGTLAPPVSGQAAAGGISVSGADFATTVRVRLTTASAQPGPNRFEVSVADYDTEEPVRGARVTLRFTPLDDPQVDPSSLALRPQRTPGTYAASGANLAFDGRWHVTVLVQRGADAVEVPLLVDVENPPQFISVQRMPGRPPAYTADLPGAGSIRISPDPERAGPSNVTVRAFTVFDTDADVDALVLTAAAADRPARQRPVRRRGRGRFVAPVRLAAGVNTIAVIARTADGTRLRSVFRLDVPP